MSAQGYDFRTQAKRQAEELLQAIEAAESVIVTTIERECEALRAGRMLAARALHTRLADASALYINAIKAARASLWTIEQVLPGSRVRLEERRLAFADTLKIEFAALAAEREAAGGASPILSFDEPAPPLPVRPAAPAPARNKRRGAR